MQARVKLSSRYGSITAFSGLEFVKYEWRNVPAGKDEEAKRNPYLELEGGEKEQPSLAKIRGVEKEQPSLESLRGVDGEEAEPEKAEEPKAEAPAKKPRGKP